MKRDDCPLCGGTRVEEIFRLPSVPVHSMILLPEAAAARAFPRGTFVLTQCSDCGFLFNAAFEAGRMAYGAAFEESQHFSPTFGRFADELVERLARSLGPRDHVVEIGCGRGEFLAALCRRTGCRGTGIDPGWRPGRLPDPLPAGLTFLAEPLGPQHAALDADLLLCRHTLEHIDEVRAFVTLAAACGGERPGFRLFFETPDAGRIVEEGAFWDLYYEHCSYFTAGTKQALFARCGLATTGIEAAFGAQYLLLEARPAANPAAAGRAAPPARGFAERLHERIATWHRRVTDWAKRGEQLVLWGGGSKAVAFLTALDLAGEIAAVVDINPHRQGRYLPGSGHPIVAPSALRRIEPDRVVVMNPLYRDEIARSLRQHGLQPAIEALG